MVILLREMWLRIVRQPKKIVGPNPALIDKVFLAGLHILRCLEWISNGYQEDILEQYEKSKMGCQIQINC